MEEVRLEPDWPQMVRWHARALATHSFEYGAQAPVGAFMDMVRYMALAQPEELQVILREYGIHHDTGSSSD